MNKSKLVKKQFKTFTKTRVKVYGELADIIVEVRYDDECSNGHNTFAITADIYKTGKRSDKAMISCGCCHDDIKKYFPELREALKYHLTSSDGPIHYISNSLYYASDKDLYGYSKGEACAWKERVQFSDFPMVFDVDAPMLRMIKDSFNFSNAEIEECKHIKDFSTYGSKFRIKGYEKYCKNNYNDSWYNCSHDDKEKLESFIKCLQDYDINIIKSVTKYSQGGKSDLEAARSCAIWPNAKLSDFTEKKLKARLPKLLKEFKVMIESFGMEY